MLGPANRDSEDLPDDQKDPEKRQPMGPGSAALTTRVRNIFGKYANRVQMEGQEAAAWPDWLEQKGFGLDDKGNVFKWKGPNKKVPDQPV